ncbi:TetR/AcrR family transcriptional regulator [Lysobacter korlensis]|uniref:TetR/AcrR family transcriptional regulator n=1 Tax=Lysobacter korlensis TaxID=553636 RepID=A0ABV6S148_9GAMM
MPRAGLSPERVVSEAELLIDEVGFEQLTLAAVAARLTVRLPSLYKHVESLGALRSQLAVRATRELADVIIRATAGRSRGDAVRALAGEYRRWALEHPGRYAATVRAPDPSNAEAVAAADAAVRAVLAVLDGYGLAGDDLIDATRSLRASLHGYLALEAAGGFGLPQSIEVSFGRHVENLVAALETAAGKAARR